MTASKLSRTESPAYASLSTASTIQSKLSYCFRSNERIVLGAGALFLFVIFASLGSVSNNAGGWTGLRLSGSGLNDFFGGAIKHGYFSKEKSKIDEHTFRFASVSDMDQLSRVNDEMLFRSVMVPGTLTFDPHTNHYSIDFEKPRTLYSKHNEAGRGMELSELIIYQNRLLAFEDRTGMVFEILSKDGGTDSYVVPRFVVTEGPGETDKGMKWEWAAVKGGKLYMGSMGKEYTNPDGTVANANNLWVATLSDKGELRREDWSDKYNFVRKALDAEFPGYLIHEAIDWSEHLKRWVFLPRRISHEQYDENLDERKGSNKLALVSENFDDVTVIDIKMSQLDPLHGFSTISFIPGTKDQHALAIRSVEEDCVGGDESQCKQRSYFIVFDVLTGEVLMDEIKYDENIKLEGVEFVDIYTPEPQTSV